MKFKMTRTDILVQHGHGSADISKEVTTNTTNDEIEKEVGSGATILIVSALQSNIATRACSYQTHRIIWTRAQGRRHNNHELHVP